jgi:hypothetical protein
MTDLTEQWKKGELPVGEYYYYTTIFSPTVHIQNFTRDVVSFQDFKETVAEVLAPVPSYEEWKGKDEALTALLAEYGKLTKELQDEKEKNMTRFSLRSPADEVIIEKQVWESTLHRSMVLQAENNKLKDALKYCQEKILLMDYDSIKIEILQKINEDLK